MVSCVAVTSISITIPLSKGKGGGGRGNDYLKSMQQTEPMPHLMHGRLAQIISVGRERRPGHAARQNVAAIGGVVRRRVLDRRPAVVALVGDGGGEGAVAQEGGGGGVGVGGGGEVGLEVEVQGLVVAAAQGLLHGGGVCVGGPGVVDGPGGGDGGEGDAGGAVEAVEDVDLCRVGVLCQFR